MVTLRLQSANYEYMKNLHLSLPYLFQFTRKQTSLKGYNLIFNLLKGNNKGVLEWTTKNKKTVQQLTISYCLQYTEQQFSVLLINFSGCPLPFKVHQHFWKTWVDNVVESLELCMLWRSSPTLQLMGTTDAWKGDIVYLISETFPSIECIGILHLIECSGILHWYRLRPLSSLVTVIFKSEWSIVLKKW